MFISNACVMTIELVAGRIIAPYVGVSLFTWTSVIGVILAGMSAGNFIGGKLTDRYASRLVLGALFALASAQPIDTDQLRRELIDMHYLDRKDGVYWLIQHDTPPPLLTSQL